MILSIFGRRASPVPLLLHGVIVAAARAPQLYAVLGVPDTVQGRFELLVVHAHLFLRRAAAGPELGDLAQAVTDEIFNALDAGLREAGVSDTSVPRRMKSMAGLFYGRIAAYDQALAEGAAALEATLARCIWPDTPAPGAAGLAAYVLRAQVHLEAQRAEAILLGDMTFPDP